MTKCFHHNDADGYCSAYWVKEFVHKKIEFIEMDYNKEFPLDSIKKDEQIFIVDFSIKPDIMRKLLKITKDVTWIDHHISAIKDYENFEKIIDGEYYDISGIRESGIAACSLTYMYFYNNWEDHICNIGSDMQLMEEKIVPEFTRLIADRDVWKFKYGDKTREYCAGLMAYDLNPESEDWERVKDIMIIQQEGQRILKYLKVTDTKNVQSNGFEIQFWGHKCIVLNSATRGSEQFDSVSKDYDMMMIFAIKGDEVITSIYTEKKGIDCSVLAKKYGGGGHKGASGFVMSYREFEKIIKLEIK